MGFVINQKIQHDTFNQLDSFYVRIEMYRLDVLQGKLHLISRAYTDKEGAKKNYSKYQGEPSQGDSCVLGQIDIDGEIIDLNDFNYFEFSLTKEVTIIEDITEEQEVTETETYFDFDDSGEVVEKTKEYTVIKDVKIDEKEVKKMKIDLTSINNDFFGHAYELLKQKYGKKFGKENIKDF